MSALIADDLFAGAGGWDLAAERLGVHARGVENMKEARATRDAASLTTIHDDVWTYRPDGKASGLIASPPCQTFSAAGKGSGRQALDDVLRGIRDDYVSDLDHLRFLGEEVGDNRTSLVLTPLHFALSGGYDWLAWEQVPTVLPVWEACAVKLRESGWNVWTGLLYSEQYGTPQTRKRAFLLGSRHGAVLPPTPTHSRYHNRDPKRVDADVANWVSMAGALGWQESDLVGFPRLADSDDVVTIEGRHYRARDLRSASAPSQVVTEKARSWQRWDLVSPQSVAGGDRARRTDDQPAITVTSNFDRARWVLRNNSSANAAERSPEEPAPTLYFGQRSNYCAWEWRGEGEAPDLPEWAFNRPSTTIVGSFKPEIVAAPGYRTTVSRQNAPGSVRVTVQEAGVLQSFPADYPWQGAKGKQFLQCGNAVPPLMAQAALTSVVPKVAEVAA